MARILKAHVRGHWDKQTYRGGQGCDCKDIYDCMAQEKAEMDSIGWENIMHFPVADGSAYYMVVHENPLTLAWIPYGDAWQLTTPYLKGLNHEDLVMQRKWDAMWRNLSDERKMVNVGD
ncbi:hypothetical protein CMI37_04445 [Candidatus Pacearchaeota archaeon]|nr:hypothetical protein [Candidatus Pacearchaeota archaeon]|tara:strand:+ start:2508 stop:2864 length:357 start_codon:yes stop_codon:yes gene_type:complete